MGISAVNESAVRYVTVADDLSSCTYGRLNQSAIQHFIALENAATPQKGHKAPGSTFGRSKMDSLLAWLKGLPKEQIVVYVDSSATAIVAGVSAMLRGYAEILAAQARSLEDTTRPCEVRRLTN